MLGVWLVDGRINGRHESQQLNIYEGRNPKSLSMSKARCSLWKKKHVSPLASTTKLKPTEILRSDKGKGSTNLILNLKLFNVGQCPKSRVKRVNK